MALVLDTLGWVYMSMERGLTRDEAERAAMATRDFIREMEAAGMSGEEIQQRFAEIHEDLKRQRLEREATAASDGEGVRE